MGFKNTEKITSKNKIFMPFLIYFPPLTAF
jgi:hypothetical protein